MRYYYLATYDICDDKRLRRLFKLLRGYGEHVQYSIFLCQLTDKDRLILTEKIKDIIHHDEDQAILIRLGQVDGKRKSLPRHWDVLGKKVQIHDTSVSIY